VAGAAGDDASVSDSGDDKPSDGGESDVEDDEDEDGGDELVQ